MQLQQYNEFIRLDALANYALARSYLDALYLSLTGMAVAPGCSTCFSVQYGKKREYITGYAKFHDTKRKSGSSTH